MKNIPCNLCGSDSKKLLFYKGEYRIVKCANCDLAFVDPQPDEEEIKRFYSRHQTCYLGSYPKKEKSKLRDANREVKRIRRLLKNARGISILDIGCSCGFLLKAATDAGWDAYGVDISEMETEYAQRKYQVKAITANFPAKLPFKNSSFEVITMFDLLEHLTDPLKGLQECHRLLKDSGILVIGTPDFGHRRARIEQEKWGHLKPPEHLFYFSITTLRMMLEKAKFGYIGRFLRVPWKDGIKAVFIKQTRG